ncbi:MAG: hypothetical protein H7070_12005 [Saprospiraceae bacterium]|nr:hypothetical protein [Pyrinomonadaceae bacterium]
MENAALYEIISFYEFKPLIGLESMKQELKTLLREWSVFGTIIIAGEGYNASLCGEPQKVKEFLKLAERVFNTNIKYKSSFHAEKPFRKHEVKIKPEIVTLKKEVDISKGVGTHVKPEDWNQIISAPGVVLLDARNYYEHKNGTFKNAVDPKTEKFSDLPQFVAETFDPKTHTKIAMFCTGGIRCEKFAPYMKELGFAEIFQLEGGILKYLEDVPKDEQLWEGECFVFDERRTLDEKLEKGSGIDYSQRYKNKKKF